MGFLSKQSYSSYSNTVNTRAVLRTSILHLTTFSLFSKHLLMEMWLSVKAKWANMSSMLKSLEELTQPLLLVDLGLKPTTYISFY